MFFAVFAIGLGKNTISCSCSEFELSYFEHKDNNKLCNYHKNVINLWNLSTIIKSATNDGTLYYFSHQEIRAQSK